MRLKAWAPALLRKQPETFCCTLTMRRSLSARLLSKSTRRSERQGEDGFLLFAQAIEQIARVTLFAATPFPRGSRGPRVRLIPFIEQTEELRFPIHDFQRVKPVLSLLARLLCRLFHIQQEGFEVCSPLDALLCEKHEVARAYARCKRHAHSRTRSTIPIRREPRCR